MLKEVGAGAFFRPSQAAELGIGPEHLRRLVAAGIVEHFSRGLYRLTDAEPTAHYTLAAVAARVPLSVVCLLSALQVHEITTQLPHRVWIGIPHKARPPRLPEIAIQLVRFTGASWTYGVEETRFEGVPARITNPARTVVDCFRFRRLVGHDVAQEALRDALRERLSTPAQIWRTAEMCRARSLVGPYLEALTG